MTKVLKYLKPFTLSIILVIGLLIVQATCDLSLPDEKLDKLNDSLITLKEVLNEISSDF